MGSGCVNAGHPHRLCLAGRTRAGRHRWIAPLRPSSLQIASLATRCSLLCEWYIHRMVEGSLGPGPELSGTWKATHKH